MHSYFIHLSFKLDILNYIIFMLCLFTYSNNYIILTYLTFMSKSILRT